MKKILLVSICAFACGVTEPKTRRMNEKDEYILIKRFVVDENGDCREVSEQPEEAYRSQAIREFVKENVQISATTALITSILANITGVKALSSVQTRAVVGALINGCNNYYYHKGSDVVLSALTGCIFTPGIPYVVNYTKSSFASAASRAKRNFKEFCEDLDS